MVCTLPSHLIWNLLLIGVWLTLNIDSWEITLEIETIQYHLNRYFARFHLTDHRYGHRALKCPFCWSTTTAHSDRHYQIPFQGPSQAFAEWWHIFVRLCHQSNHKIRRFFEVCQKIVVTADDDDRLGWTAVAWDGWEWSSNYPLFCPARPLILQLGARPLILLHTVSAT